MLSRIRIVLVNTSHPGNIGSAARAMKTMGINQLTLVAPEAFPHQKAVELSAGATDILDQAVVVNTLEEAVADCTLVVGTSARFRRIPWPLLTPRQMADKVKAEPETGLTAIVFGREQSGLTNEELERCHCHIHIPANPDYSSLNLAMAVQIAAYELRMASLGEIDFSQDWDFPPASAESMEQYFEHLERVFTTLDFIKTNAPRKSMTRLRRLFYRARPDIMEMNMLRGMLTSIEDATKK
ncbi:MAG TPA: tRNA (cytosine(32)/uridine(32)-2'-O)-methyltransferase TrmJ [Gammaproteobacteria bacterium]|jgi:tRNA (cytidine32/uridine32-2'-O)-methyltransferase|nr:tRNA (cytosine(32)/uridine(32)-2'-O)-methyltransferase TrmJ [Gammaproteobacteria bacterium]